MTTKSIFLFSLICVAGIARAENPVAAVVYRGRVTLASTGAAVTKEIPASFRLYQTKAATVPLWGVTMNILPSANGTFQVTLRDGLAATYLMTNSLASILQKGSARYIGVTLGATGTAEIYPRQRLMAAPLVAQAAYAGSVMSGGSVENVSVSSKATASSAQISGSLQVGGELKATGSNQSLTLDTLTAASGSSVELSAPTDLQIFARSAFVSRTFQTPPSGTVLYTAGSQEGVLTVIADGDWTMPCLTIPLRANESFSLPVMLLGPVRVYFLPFGTSL